MTTETIMLVAVLQTPLLLQNHDFDLPLESYTRWCVNGQSLLWSRIFALPALQVSPLTVATSHW